MAERGKSFVNTNRAFRIGQSGLLLKEGDSILVGSDGLFGVNPEDRQPYLHQKELLLHAMDDDVERAGRALMKYAAARRPARVLQRRLHQLGRRLQSPNSHL